MLCSGYYLITNRSKNKAMFTTTAHSLRSPKPSKITLWSQLHQHYQHHHHHHHRACNTADWIQSLVGSRKNPAPNAIYSRRHGIPSLWPLVSSSVRGQKKKKLYFVFSLTSSVYMRCHLQKSIYEINKQNHVRFFFTMLLPQAMGDLASESQDWSWRDGWEFEHLELWQGLRFGSQNPMVPHSRTSENLFWPLWAHAFRWYT